MMATDAPTKRRKAKRGNGEGSIYQRKHGLWTCQATLPNQHRRYIVANTHNE